ncbi:MAG: trypsin-like peptidase domain-containing protein [Candidatus Heimdallarchaeota archaeon]|nr:trypsin-like peptidase domain-containing protein [Candidatus Heimdallarchaeota archaeon]MCK4253714.1 trypsin-like peptidase domain-containing protein [Candidatus Heimdallarchaeota archaeon]
MSIPNTIKTDFLFSTVRIETKDENKSQGVGTGFLFEYFQDEDSYVFLVTNKHVIKDAQEGFLQFNLSHEESVILGDFYKLAFEDFECEWYLHPEEDIDIAIMPFGPVLHELEKRNIDIFFRTIDSSLIPTEKDLEINIDTIEDILFIGYPNNLYDKENLIPIVRKGITATPICIDFNSKPIFLIDASVFPGSSGSPVLICETDIEYPRGYRKLFFLGILSEGYVQLDENEIEFREIPVDMKPVAISKDWLDLGRVFKSHLIKKLAEEFLISVGEIE